MNVCRVQLNFDGEPGLHDMISLCVSVHAVIAVCVCVILKLSLNLLILSPYRFIVIIQEGHEGLYTLLFHVFLPFYLSLFISS